MLYMISTHLPYMYKLRDLTFLKWMIKSQLYEDQ